MKTFDLNAPGAIDRLLAEHKARFGDMRMSNDDPTTTPLGLQPDGSITVPVPAAPAPTPNPGWNEEEYLKSPAVIALLESVRKQEKDKLYPQINDLKTQVDSLSASKAAEVEAAAKAAAKKAEEEAQKRFEETTAKDLIAQTRSEFEQRLADLQNEREQERAMHAKEKSFLELAQYTQGAVQKALENGEIAPELAPMVSGNNIDEVNASLETVRATSAAIVANMQAAMQQAQAAAPQRGVSPTGHAPVGPMDLTGGTRTLSPADIAGMSMSEYAKLRPQLGVQQANRSVGIFG